MSTYFGQFLATYVIRFRFEMVRPLCLSVCVMQMYIFFPFSVGCRHFCFLDAPIPFGPHFCSFFWSQGQVNVVTGSGDKIV